MPRAKRVNSKSGQLIHGRGIIEVLEFVKRKFGKDKKVRLYELPTTPKRFVAQVIAKKQGNLGPSLQNFYEIEKARPGLFSGGKGLELRQRGEFSEGLHTRLLNESLQGFGLGGRALRTGVAHMRALTDKHGWPVLEKTETTTQKKSALLSMLRNGFKFSGAESKLAALSLFGTHDERKVIELLSKSPKWKGDWKLPEEIELTRKIRLGKIKGLPVLIGSSHAHEFNAQKAIKALKERGIKKGDLLGLEGFSRHEKFSDLPTLILALKIAHNDAFRALKGPIIEIKDLKPGDDLEIFKKNQELLNEINQIRFMVPLLEFCQQNKINVVGIDLRSKRFNGASERKNPQLEPYISAPVRENIWAKSIRKTKPNFVVFGTSHFDAIRKIVPHSEAIDLGEVLPEGNARDLELNRARRNYNLRKRLRRVKSVMNTPIRLPRFRKK